MSPASVLGTAGCCAANPACCPAPSSPHPPQLLRMHLLENVRVRVEAGHFDFINELR